MRKPPWYRCWYYSPEILGRLDSCTFGGYMDNEKEKLNLLELVKKSAEIAAKASMYVDRWVEVISDFNGQAVGSSKKSLRGKRFKIIGVFVETKTVYFYLSYDHTTSASLDDIKFVNQ